MSYDQRIFWLCTVLVPEEARLEPTKGRLYEITKTQLINKIPRKMETLFTSPVYLGETLRPGPS